MSPLAIADMNNTPEGSRTLGEFPYLCRLLTLLRFFFLSSGKKKKGKKKRTLCLWSPALFMAPLPQGKRRLICTDLFWGQLL